MRRITVSVLSIFITIPAVAGANLPVVNVGAAGVSARAAFGDVPVKSSDDANIAARASAPAVVVSPVKKASQKVTPRVAKKATVDTGEKIAAADVLMPRRPSSDLWAKVDAPLRMPTESEISVVRADYDLPEESLDAAPRANVVARAPEKAASPADDMDAQIARLIELQRRADESARTASAQAAPRAVASRPAVIAAPVVASRDVVAESKTADAAPAPVKISRMVVPMDDDVVVRTVEKTASPRIAAVRDDMSRMNPSELRKAFRKTYLSENKHLSTYQIDDRFDVASDMSTGIEGFTAARDLSEAGGVRPLEIKIRFRGDDAALSRDNYNLLTEYAGIVVSNPKRAIQVSIPQRATTNMDDRKLAARRLAIVEQVLRDTGVSEQRIMPVLSQRNEDGFVLRVISSDQYETLSEQKRNIFGDTVGKKTYKSISW